MSETVLVSGATGVIGSEIVKELLSRGMCVRIAVRDIRRARHIETGGCPVVVLDYLRPQTFKEALSGVDSMFVATPMTLPRLHEVLLPVIDFARKVGISHLVSLGALGLNLNSDSPRMIFERCIECCGLDYTILRPNLLMQNLVQVAGNGIRKSGTISVCAGESKVSFVDGRDVAKAAAEALTDRRHRNRMYVLTGSESLDHVEIARILSAVTGRAISYKPITHNEMRRNLHEAGCGTHLTELMIGLYEIARQGWCNEYHPDLADIIKCQPTRFVQFAQDYKDQWT